MKINAAAASAPAPGAAWTNAVAALQPFFDPQLTWSGVSLEHFAYRALRERHPELTIAQAYVMVVAARRLYAARRTTGAQQASRPGVLTRTR